MTDECRIINGRVIVNGDKGLQERTYTENLTQLIKLENQRDLLLKKDRGNRGEAKNFGCEAEKEHFAKNSRDFLENPRFNWLCRVDGRVV